MSAEQSVGPPSLSGQGRSPLKIGVCGAGMIGRQHVRLLAQSPRWDMVAIADPAPMAAELAGQYGARCFATQDEMLDAIDLDAVVLAVPNHLHRPAALSCIERGIPALLEKPLAESLESGQAIVEAAERTGSAVLVGHHRRHTPQMMAARKLIRDGALGRIVAVSGLWFTRKPDDYFDAAWRRQAGGGPLLINLIHDLDCLRFLLGEIASVQAVTRNGIRGFEVEDTGAVLLTFASGAIGSFAFSDAIPSPWHWDLASGQGAIFPHVYGDTYFIGGTAASLGVPSMRLHWHADGEDWRRPPLSTTKPTEHGDCYVTQLDHFADVTRGLADPVCGPRDALGTLAATLAAATAAREGRAVPASPAPPSAPLS